MQRGVESQRHGSAQPAQPARDAREAPTQAQCGGRSRRGIRRRLGPLARECTTTTPVVVASKLVGTVSGDSRSCRATADISPLLLQPCWCVVPRARPRGIIFEIYISRPSCGRKHGVLSGAGVQLISSWPSEPPTPTPTPTLVVEGANDQQGLRCDLPRGSAASCAAAPPRGPRKLSWVGVISKPM
jgi:hypothetical protein